MYDLTVGVEDGHRVSRLGRVRFQIGDRDIHAQFLRQRSEAEEELTPSADSGRSPGLARRQSDRRGLSNSCPRANKDCPAFR